MNIDNPYFDGMVNQVYPPELQLNKAYATDTNATFLVVSSKIYDKRDDFKFDVVNFPFLDGDVDIDHYTSYGPYVHSFLRLRGCLVM